MNEIAVNVYRVLSIIKAASLKVVKVSALRVVDARRLETDALERLP
jgi:hypothetical protein